MSAGFRIRSIGPRVTPAILEKARTLPVANVSDSMTRLTGAGGLQRFHRDGVMVGSAFTVRVRPGDNLMLHKALDMALPGDVIVVDAGGVTSNALIGELMVTHAKTRGIAGIVIDGAIRDRDQLFDINLPVFAKAVCHRGPYKDGPGEIGFQICIDGMVVHPGDLIMGDGDGVLAIPQDIAATTLEHAQKKQDAEMLQMQHTLKGSLDRSWIDRELVAKGCEFIAD